ncbi:hypothetical protein Ciccas_014009 [Cichlidogyrus casuarinus]|uniref:Uncharacterized protein n=1 Tax=Cichlidogyrus casuarinus TaxID=1844966 RepID=A0ABD2PKJ7_9PLAT
MRPSEEMALGNHFNETMTNSYMSYSRGDDVGKTLPRRKTPTPVSVEYSMVQQYGTVGRSHSQPPHDNFSPALPRPMPNLATEYNQKMQYELDMMKRDPTQEEMELRIKQLEQQNMMIESELQGLKMLMNSASATTPDLYTSSQYAASRNTFKDYVNSQNLVNAPNDLYKYAVAFFDT